MEMLLLLLLAEYEDEAADRLDGLLGLSSIVYHL